MKGTVALEGAVGGWREGAVLHRVTKVHRVGNHGGLLDSRCLTRLEVPEKCDRQRQ